MTETRAPFNGKKKELLVIELPLNEDQKQKMYDYACGETTMVSAISAIGTPLADSSLKIIGYINPLVADALRDPTSGINTTQLRAEPNETVSGAVVMKADAEAVIGILKLEITHKDENISILKESLQSIQKERDTALKAVNSFHRLLIEIEKGVKALNDPIEALEGRVRRNTCAGEKA